MNTEQQTQVRKGQIYHVFDGNGYTFVFDHVEDARKALAFEMKNDDTADDVLVGYITSDADQSYEDLCEQFHTDTANETVRIIQRIPNFVRNTFEVEAVVSRAWVEGTNWT